MRIFVIHKKGSPRKINSSIKNAKVVEPIFNKDSVVSLRLTVLDILAKNEGRDVLIFEDDVKLTEHFSLKKLKNWADKYRGKIDYINTGVLVDNQSNIMKYADNLYHVNYYLCTQGVYYLPTALEKLKASYQTDIDRMLHLKTFGLITYPFMTTQYDAPDKIHYEGMNIAQLFEKSSRLFESKIKGT